MSLIEEITNRMPRWLGGLRRLEQCINIIFDAVPFICCFLVYWHLQTLHL